MLRDLVVVEDVLGGVDGLLVHGDHQHGAHIAGGQWRSFSVYPHIEEDYIRQSFGHTSYTFALGIFTKY